MAPGPAQLALRPGRLRVRIGLVCPYDLSKPGGVQGQVRDLALRLSQDGDETLVFAPGLPDDVPGVDLGSTLSIPGNRSRVPLSVDPRVGAAIREASEGLDLLHVHEPLMPFVSLSALRAGPTVVATFHAAPNRAARGLYRAMAGRLKNVLGPKVRKLTAVSATAAAALPETFAVTIVPNGVDTAFFTPSGQRNPKRVAFLGRDEPRKGLDVLLEAWRAVIQVVPDAELVVMGADRGDAGITWMGPVDDATKAKVLGSSAIYVAPNLGGESFGVVLVEAMAAGAAVLASDLAAFQDVGADAARYFATGSSGDLAGALISLLGDPEAVTELSRAGRARAAEFDWAKVAARYRDVYLEALS